MNESVSAARAVFTRLGAFLDRFAGCFGRRAQREGASRYIQGLLNDSGAVSPDILHVYARVLVGGGPFLQLNRVIPNDSRLIVSDR